MPGTSSKRSGVVSITLKVSSLKRLTMRSANRGTDPFDHTGSPSNLSIPSKGRWQGLFARLRLELATMFGMVSHCPCRARCSPAESSGRLPTTVAKPSEFREDLLVRRWPNLGIWSAGAERCTHFLIVVGDAFHGTGPRYP